MISKKYLTKCGRIHDVRKSWNLHVKNEHGRNQNAAGAVNQNAHRHSVYTII